MSDELTNLRHLPPRPVPEEMPSLGEVKARIRAAIYAGFEDELEAGRAALRSPNPFRWRAALRALVRVLSDPRKQYIP